MARRALDARQLHRTHITHDSHGINASYKASKSNASCSRGLLIYFGATCLVARSSASVADAMAYNVKPTVRSRSASFFSWLVSARLSLCLLLQSWPCGHAAPPSSGGSCLLGPFVLVLGMEGFSNTTCMARVRLSNNPPGHATVAWLDWVRSAHRRHRRLIRSTA